MSGLVFARLLTLLIFDNFFPLGISIIGSLTEVKRLRVRGRKAIRYVAPMKAAGQNLLRAARVRRARAKAAECVNENETPIS